MALKDRLQRRSSSGGSLPPTSVTSNWLKVDADLYQELKGELHRGLIDKIDLRTLEKLSPDQIRSELHTILHTIVSKSNAPLNRSEREHMIQELLDEVTGLGPLEPLLADGSITDILVNAFQQVYVERRGQLQLTNVRFRDNDHLRQIINRIVAKVGRRVDETSPMVDARLADGSRVNAIIPPLAIDGPLLSIRRFGESRLKVRDLITLGSMTPEMLGFLGACVGAKVNMLISGGTGTGKTTLLNAISFFISEDERIVTIEDAAELQLQQQHVARLETRPPNIEGKGEVVARDLVRNSLRMRPDRIIVGEVRSSEVLDMLQAMNTGHEGSMTTVHANSPRDALTRLESMIGMSGVPISESVARQSIARGIQVLVQLTRYVDGRRRVSSISEISGTEGSVITMQEIFRFNQTGIDDEGHVLGEYIQTGIRPKIMDRILQFGIDPDEVVQPFLEA